MNKVYRTVWNEHTNTWVAVAEIAKAHGKSGKSSLVSQGVKALTLSLSMTGLYVGSSAPAYALGSPGIFINNYQDGGCSGTIDEANYVGIFAFDGDNPSGNALSNGQPNVPSKANFGIKAGFNPCRPTGNNTQQFDTQTNRTLFYGDVIVREAADEKAAGSKNLTLGGRLDVNSGVVGVGTCH